ncbi:MAG: DUF86 domain-containing protein [Patescibacteria group bacterium]
MKKNDLVYLNHILEAVCKIEKYTTGVSYDDFSKNDMMIDAVVRELEIIGEAAKNLSGDFREKYIKFPLRESADMRNFLIHEYFGVNSKIVWNTCKNDLPDLRAQTKSIIQGHNLS